MSLPQLHHLNASVVRRANLALLTGLLALAGAAASAADANLVRLTAQQQRSAGIVLEPVRTALAGGASEQLLSGTVVAGAEGTAVLSSMVGGVVQQVHVTALQEVRAGTPVVTLFSQQLVEWQRDYLQLATQSSLAQKKLARDEAMFADGIIARARLEDSRAAAEQAAVMASERRQALRAAGLSAAQLATLLERHSMAPGLTLAAASAGTVLELPLTPGQHVEAGMPLARIARAAPLWVEFQASPALAARLRPGAELTLNTCGSVRIKALSPQLNAGNQSVLVRARQERADGCLKLNQFVEARVVAETAVAGSVAVPAGALVQRGATTYVFVQQGADFRAMAVASAPADGGWAWVKPQGDGKLGADNKVAVRGLAALKGAWMGLGTEGQP